MKGFHTVIISIRFESTQIQERGELCWQIFVSFWEHAGELFGQGVCNDSRTGISANISRKVNRSNTVFLRGNTSSPTEVKNHDLLL